MLYIDNSQWRHFRLLTSIIRGIRNLSAAATAASLGSQDLPSNSAGIPHRLWGCCSDLSSSDSLSITCQLSSNMRLIKYIGNRPAGPTPHERRRQNIYKHIWDIRLAECEPTGKYNEKPNILTHVTSKHGSWKMFRMLRENTIPGLLLSDSDRMLRKHTPIYVLVRLQATLEVVSKNLQYVPTCSSIPPFGLSRRHCSQQSG